VEIGGKSLEQLLIDSMEPREKKPKNTLKLTSIFVYLLISIVLAWLGINWSLGRGITAGIETISQLNEAERFIEEHEARTPAERRADVERSLRERGINVPVRR